MKPSYNKPSHNKRSQNKPSRTRHSGATGFFAGSFDPPTLGHIDIIGRASRLFERLIVGVGQNTKKPTKLLSVNVRLDLLAEICASFANVSVVAYDGMTVSAARTFGATTLVRGLRSSADFPFEQQIAWANRQLADDLDTVFVSTSQSYSHISSSLVREVIHAGGSYKLMVPPLVARKIAENISAEV